jgi:hypothetical protein
MTKKDLLVSAEFLLDREWVRIARESTAAPECCFTSDDAGLPENELWCSNIGCAAVCFDYTGSMVFASVVEPKLFVSAPALTFKKFRLQIRLRP